MLKRLFQFIAGWRTTIIIGGVLLTTGFGAGYYTSAKFAEAEKAEMRAEANEQLREAVDRAVKQAEKIRAIDHEVMASFDERDKRIETQTRTVTKEIPKYVASSVKRECDCRLNRGAVRLLNIARTGNQGSELRLPGTPAFPDDQARTPSEVTQRAEVRAHAQCGERFRNVRSQLIHLQEWVAKQTDRADAAR